MLISAGSALSVSPGSFADSTPMLATNRIYLPNNAIALSARYATYAEIYRSQLWVATLVNKLAMSTARLPLKVYDRNGGPGRPEVRDTPYAKLLRTPNSRHDPFFFWLWTASTFEVYGEALWVKIRPGRGRPPTSLWPLHPSNVYTRRDVETGDLVYAYHIGSAQQPVLEFPSADVVHFKSYNPDDQVRGMSRLEPLRSSLLNDDAARSATQAFWANGARPSVLLSTPNTVSGPAMDRLKASWDASHRGVENWSKTAILEEGLTPHIVQLNAEEMQYVESRRLNREEACAIYDVPPPAVHILDRATFSNITEQNRMVYRDTMAPRLGLYESVLDSQLRPDFDVQGNTYAEFLLDEVLRGDFEARSAAYAEGIRAGWLKPSEVREMENRTPVEGADNLFINSATVPLGTIGAAPAAGQNVAIAPQTVKACAGCQTETKALSPRGLCRSCEGQRG